MCLWNKKYHALDCKKGGFVAKRHNEVRDIEAELLSEVCTAVSTEPRLLPITGEQIHGNRSPEARLDVSAVGFWSPQELTFLDVRIFNPNCPSYADKEPPEVYKFHENQKKLEYSDRILNVERASFVPLIFSTSGGWSKETTFYHKRLAKLIANRRNEEYRNIITFIRKRLRFSILRTTLLSLRGNRFTSKFFEDRNARVVDLDMDLIEQQNPDEVYA